MKRFLLCGGDHYYPCSGDGDWFGFYDTSEEAESKVNRNSGLFERCEYILIDGDKSKKVDWYHIVDLKYWGLYV